MTYDPRCHDLASVFLTDERRKGDTDALMRKLTDDLAQQIQDVIEGFLEFDLEQMRKEYAEGEAEEAEEMRRER